MASWLTFVAVEAGAELVVDKAFVEVLALDEEDLAVDEEDDFAVEEVLMEEVEDDFTVVVVLIEEDAVLEDLVELEDFTVELVALDETLLEPQLPAPAWQPVPQ